MTPWPAWREVEASWLQPEASGLYAAPAAVPLQPALAEEQQ